MGEENQRGHDDSVRLPLHPRKAQELFFELLQAGPSSSSDATTPRDAPTPRSFQQRLARSQQYCTDALKVLQRGQWVRSRSKRRGDPMVQLRLSRDGVRLEALAFASTASDLASGSEQQDQEEEQGAVQCVDALDLATLRSLAVFPNACFALLTTASDTAQDGATLFQCPFEAESDDVLACIAVAVASTVSAQRDKTALNQQDVLLWQAARLRIVELLASGMPLRDAIAAMEAAYDALSSRETQCDLPARGTLFVLRAG